MPFRSSSAISSSVNEKVAKTSAMSSWSRVLARASRRLTVGSLVPSATATSLPLRPSRVRIRKVSKSIRSQSRSRRRRAASTFASNTSSS